MATHLSRLRRALPAPDDVAPRVREGAKALVASSDRLLLVKERHRDGSPFWTFPGGGVEAGETPVEALGRELSEELRCAARVAEPVGTFCYAHVSKPGTLSRHTVFDCELLSAPRPAPSEGILDARWVSPADLPATTLPNVRYLLRECGAV